MIRMDKFATWAITADGPKPLMKCNLKASRGFARIGNTVHHEDFATKLLVTLAHPQNKGASRTVRDALVRSFIAGGNPAALLLPCDKTIYSIAVKKSTKWKH